MLVRSPRSTLLDRVSTACFRNFDSVFCRILRSSDVIKVKANRKKESGLGGAGGLFVAVFFFWPARIAPTLVLSHGFAGKVSNWSASGGPAR